MNIADDPLSVRRQKGFANPPEVRVNDEYSELECVVMTRPTAFRVDKPLINTTQQRWVEDPPLPEAVLKEQANFEKVLVEYGVDIIWVPNRSDLPEQIDTRDAGVVIDNNYMVSRMRHPIRQAEPELIVETLGFPETSLVRINSGYVEGGDVLIDGNTVLVGIGERTNKAGADELACSLPYMHFEFVELANGTLHLDTALTLLPKRLALFHSLAVKKRPEILSGFDVIDITEEEFSRVGVNVFCVNPEAIVVDGQNPRIADELSKRGLKVHMVDFTNITRNGGSFRCQTLPLRRRRSVGSSASAESEINVSTPRFHPQAQSRTAFLARALTARSPDDSASTDRKRSDTISYLLDRVRVHAHKLRESFEVQDSWDGAVVKFIDEDHEDLSELGVDTELVWLDTVLNALVDSSATVQLDAISPYVINCIDVNDVVVAWQKLPAAEKAGIYIAAMFRDVFRHCRNMRLAVLLDDTNLSGVDLSDAQRDKYVVQMARLLFQCRVLFPEDVPGRDYLTLIFQPTLI